MPILRRVLTQIKFCRFLDKEEIDNIFKTWEEYIPMPIYETIEEPPKYKPIPKKAGPKPITLEGYKKKHEKIKEGIKQFRENQEFHTPKKRGGKKLKFQQACAD